MDPSFRARTAREYAGREVLRAQLRWFLARVQGIGEQQQRVSDARVF